RAFPETQMSTHFIGGVAPTPAAMVDEKGNQIILDHITDPRDLERFARHLCITMGCVSVLALPLMTGEQARTTSVPRTLSLAKRVGEAVRQTRENKQPVIDSVLAITGGSALFSGKLIDVQRRTIGGFARGDVLMEGLDRYSGQSLHIAFQNENLVATQRANGTETVLASVPDLICIL